MLLHYCRQALLYIVSLHFFATCVCFCLLYFSFFFPYFFPHFHSYTIMPLFLHLCLSWSFNLTHFSFFLSFLLFSPRLYSSSTYFPFLPLFVAHYSRLYFFVNLPFFLSLSLSVFPSPRSFRHFSIYLFLLFSQMRCSSCSSLYLLFVCLDSNQVWFLSVYIFFSFA